MWRTHVEFREVRVEALILDDASVDCVISNQARDAGVEYGVKSISPLATKTAD